MSKQTAVEWLVEKYELVGMLTPPMIERAKVMEREQRLQDFKEGFQVAVDSLQAANNSVQSRKIKGGEQ